MSSTTWTPRAVATDSQETAVALWRAVEAQHVVATRVLVDTLAEQELLEDLLDDSKPSVPGACSGLDYLLFTPFRYPSSHFGSRFRSIADPGTWYGADQIATACAELGYWRWRFVRDSRGLTRLDGVAHTIFQATAAGRSIDLRRKPFARDRARWTDPDNYRACQDVARVARDAAIQILRYESVRDPAQGGCAAVLDCRTFVGRGGIRRRQTWFLTVDAQRASWIRAQGGPRREDEAFEYTYG